MSAHDHDHDREHDAPEPAERTRRWVDEHTEPASGEPKGLEDVAGTPDVDDLRRQQHREMRSTGLGTEGQFRGAATGTLIGGVGGALLGVLVGWIALSGIDGALRVVLPLIVGAAAGAAAGFVYLGGRTPELENETTTASGRPQIGSSPRDPGTDERGR